jgi:glycosyltransferase involved in cell wall biosynthesis
MRPLRITILQGAFFPVPPVRGGAVEKLWYALGREFAAAGHLVTQVSRAVPELPATSEEAGVRHVRVRGYDQPRNGLRLKWRDLQYTRRALAAAPDGDVIVTNTFWAPLLARQRHGKIYVSVERMPKGQMRLYRRAARLRACSQAVRQAIEAEAPGLADRVRVVPNPLPFAPTEPVIWEEKRKEIIFVGRIHPAKGVTMLLDAFARARRDGRLGAEWRLRLAGPADEARGGGGEIWWHGELARRGLDAVQWLGPVYDAKALDTLYRQARIMAYPTVDAAGEAMPIAPLEAMAWGCAPVVSALACFKDYLHDGDNGVVFDHMAADPVEALASALGRSAGAEGERWAKAAMGVRASHATVAVAALLLADFRTLTDHDVTNHA